MTRPLQPSWFRPHAAPLCIGLVVIAALVFLNLPGDWDEGGRFHGWPFTYLTRRGPLSGCFYVSVPDIWSLTSHVEHFRPLVLAANAAIVLSLGTALTVALEWWRRRHGSLLRFSLRSVAIGVLLLSVPLGWLNYRISKWHQERPIVQHIEALGGIVQSRSLLPDWLCEMLPEAARNPFEEIWYVSLAHSQAKDQDLAYVGMLCTMSELDLSATHITSRGLAHLRHLDLKWLSLDESKIDDQGLAYLHGMQRLEWLSCDDTRAGDAGIRCLRELARLEGLSLRKCRVTDAGVREMRALRKLHYVYAEGCSISQAAVDQLRAEAPSLYVFYID